MHHFAIAILALTTAPAHATVFDCSAIGAPFAPASHVNAQCEDLCTYDAVDNAFECDPGPTVCLDGTSGDLELTVINNGNLDLALVGFGNCATSAGYIDFCCIHNPTVAGREVEKVVVTGTDGFDDLAFSTSTQGWLLAGPTGTRKGYIYGRHGDDTISGSRETDTAYDEYLHGDNGRDEIYGLNGDDYLYGESGTDYLYGGDGDDC